MVGGCQKGAIVTVSPRDAAVTLLVWYAADGGVAVITVAGQVGETYLLRAWTKDDGTYLGEYSGSG